MTLLELAFDPLVIGPERNGSDLRPIERRRRPRAPRPPASRPSRPKTCTRASQASGSCFVRLEDLRREVA